jgi:peptide/nickel transport system substrate-binding protein
MASRKSDRQPPPPAGRLSANRREIVAGALAVAGLFALGGASSSTGRATLALAKPKTPSTVRWGYNLPTRWDPVSSVTGYDIHLLGLVYSGLTRLDAAGAAQPALAASWAFNEAGTELSFFLKPNLKFSDGADVDAEAVRRHLNRARTQTNSSAKEPLESIAKIEVDGPLAVRLVLNRPDYQLPLVLAGRPGLIASPAAADASLDRLEKWPVGAGPFKLIEVETESYAYLVKDPNYWDAANIFIDRIELIVALDKISIVPAIRSGVYDIAEINPNQVDEARRAGLTVEFKPTTEARAVLININDAPFTDPRVVEAVRRAINRQEFIDKITFGHAHATNQPFPPSDAAFNKEIGALWSYDLDRAKRILADAGYKRGDIKVTIKGEAAPVLEILQTQLRALGISARIQTLQAAQVQSEIMIRKECQIATNIGTQGRESPVLGLQAAYGATGNLNLSGPYAPKALTDAIDRVRATPLDAPEYRAVLDEAIKVAVTLNPTIWLYSSPRILAYSPRITDVPSVPITYRWEGAKVAA